MRPSDFVTPEAADAIVETMFKWLYDRHYMTDNMKEHAKSTIAAIVCDATSAHIQCQPLHDAYARAKSKRGIA